MTAELSVDNLTKAAAGVSTEVLARIDQHLKAQRSAASQTSQTKEVAALRVQEQALCVSAVEGGTASIAALRAKLNELKGAHLPSQKWQKASLVVSTVVRSLRDGRDAERAVKFLGEIVDADAEPPKVEADKALSHSFQPELLSEWVRLAQATGNTGTHEALSTQLDDALTLMVREGEVLRSGGVNFWQVEFVTRLMRQLADHRLGILRTNTLARGNANTAIQMPRRMSDAIDAIHVPSRKKMLQEAVTAFGRSGDLREEVLPLVWQGTGLHKDDYPAALQLLVAAGMLFPIVQTLGDRRWVMPTRLPLEQPADVKKVWNVSKEKFDFVSLAYPLGRFTPQGLTERIIVALYSFGSFVATWRNGCLLHLTLDESLR